MRYYERRPSIEAIQINRTDDSIKEVVDAFRVKAVHISMDIKDPTPVTFITDNWQLSVAYGDFICTKDGEQPIVMTRGELYASYEPAVNR